MREELNIDKYMKADGTVDFDKLYEPIGENTAQAIKKLEKLCPDGVLKDTEKLRIYDNRNKKEQYVVYSLEEQETKRLERKERRIKAKLEKELRDKDLKNTKELPYKLKDIPSTRDTVDDIIKACPELESFLNHVVNDRPFENYGQTHTINVRNVTKYGRSFTKVVSNNKTVDLITKLNPIHFGSIQDFMIDSLPKSLFRAKGTEKIIMYESDKENRKGTYMISRRFISKLISFWSYIVGVKYIINNPEDNRITGLRLWGYPKIFYGLDNKKMEQYFGTGEECISIIKDILHLMRREPYNPMKLSDNLNSVIQKEIDVRKLAKQKATPETIIKEMQDRLYFNFQEYDKSWSYPIVSSHYLRYLMGELSSGQYDLTLLLPLIYDLRNFPIKCTDMTVKPMTNEEHEANIKENDLNEYIYERD